MPPTPQTEPTPADVPSPQAVREQLKRLLAHPLFAHSKRYPVLLAYTVEQTLRGHGDQLKERTIGIEAFGREPNYDVNDDPVVRMTAAEVRKRLSQYYYDHSHAGEWIIELPVGSYLPSFHSPERNLPPPTPSPVAAPRSSRTRLLALLLLVLLAGFALGHLPLPHRASNLERFWMPLSASSSRITYCLGEPGQTADHKPIDQPVTPLSGSLDVSDVTTLARALMPIARRHDGFRVLAASETTFAQLREGPVVLIGAYDNAWTMRISQNLPFAFVYEDGLRKIIDRKDKRFWTLEWQIPETKLARDYAVVARIHDPLTGQPVILLAGILGEGTEAASEAVSSPEFLDLLLQQLPSDWDQKNLEVVIATQVIDGHPGPPRLVAVRYW
jgi:hypothetical protein